MNNIPSKKFTILIVICFIFLYHYYIQNGLEKLFNRLFFTSPDILRPLENCRNNIYTSTSCVGMPSGHAETSTIFFYLLYIYKFIPLTICILCILLISIQRVVSNMHTVLQVMLGIIVGFIYAQIYIMLNISSFSFLFVFIIGFILVILSVNIIDSKIQQPIPKWVDTRMYSSIKKKMTTPYYMKMLTVYCNAISQDITFVSWNQLELYLDNIIERINKSGIHFDAIIGIKTGGAIISDYISKKLNIKNYKVKLTRSEYDCDKKPIDAVNDIVQKHMLSNFGEYTVCEGIDEDLRGKNVILIDEMVSSGSTMLSTIKYLREEKHIDVIFPTSIAFAKNLYKGDIYINYVVPKVVYVWPWGYDN